jgi:hypothetical protein
MLTPSSPRRKYDIDHPTSVGGRSGSEASAEQSRSLGDADKAVTNRSLHGRFTVIANEEPHLFSLNDDIDSDSGRVSSMANRVRD